MSAPARPPGERQWDFKYGLPCTEMVPTGNSVRFETMDTPPGNERTGCGIETSPPFSLPFPPASNFKVDHGAHGRWRSRRKLKTRASQAWNCGPDYHVFFFPSLSASASFCL